MAMPYNENGQLGAQKIARLLVVLLCHAHPKLGLTYTNMGNSQGYLMKKLLYLCLLALLSFNAQAAWQLNNEQSLINFVSIKASSIAEVHHFKSLSGSISDKTANVSIDLLSVETNIPIRNERMKSMLFDTSKYSSTTITTSIDPASFSDLKVGEHYQEKLNLMLDLHGITNAVPASVGVVKLDDDSLLVYSVNPVIINAADFGLNKGIEALRSIANLPVISSAVPVTFNLVFNQ